MYRDCVCHSIHEYIKILLLQNDWVEINMTYWNGCMSMLHRMKTKQNQKNYKTANTLSAAERKRIFFNIGFLSSPAHRFSERYISERDTEGPCGLHPYSPCYFIFSFSFLSKLAIDFRYKTFRQHRSKNQYHFKIITRTIRL